MLHWLSDHGAIFRLGVFLSILLTMGLWELTRPALRLRESRRSRWLGNFGILLLGTLTARYLVPIGAVGFAWRAQSSEMGLLNQLDLPLAVEITIAMVALDLVIYIQHVVFHKVPWLWRLHKVHHADRDYDVSTALRFHPLEILLSLGIKIAAVCALGAPALSVLLFEIVLSSAATFNHANVHLLPRLDSLLRLVIVTPDMHRIHHSVVREETNSNYGFNLPWWDRIFCTYIAEPRDGKSEITIGLKEYQDQRRGLIALLMMPFRRAGHKEAEL